MNVLKRLFAFMRFRSRKTDETAICNMAYSFSTSDKDLESAWSRFPRRLHEEAQKRMRALIDDRANIANVHLPETVRRARMCGVEISPEAERSLYRTAFEAGGIGGKIHFAGLLHGRPLPIDVVTDIARAFRPFDRSCFAGKMAMINGLIEEEAAMLVKIIDPNNDEHVQALIGTVASQGYWLGLVALEECLDCKADDDMLRSCLNALLSGTYFFEDVIALCRRLKDWGTAMQLIDRWKDMEPSKDRRYTTPRQYAAQLALILYEEGQLQSFIEL